MEIPLLIPDLPSVGELVPYLRRIDETRWYTNFGPLTRELEATIAARIATHGGPDQNVVSVANATLGLEVALIALGLPLGSRILMPALTFVATATAVLRAGLVPVFCDVDPSTWLLTPAIATRAIAQDRVDAVMPVATYGCPCDASAWDAFSKSTGLPIVIDAAGAYGNQACGERVTVIFSLHATKSLAAAEGGLVISSNFEYAERVRRLTNFGINAADATARRDGSTGLIAEQGTNAKMSEYHAAVGLAALGRWEKNAAKRIALHRSYIEEIRSRCPQVVTQLRDVDGIYSILPVLLPASKTAADVFRIMATAGIGTRRWYCPPLNEHPAFSASPIAGNLDHCGALGDRLLALPFHTLLSEADMRRVVSSLSQLCT